MPTTETAVESVARAFIDAYHQEPVFDSLYDDGMSMPRTRALLGAQAAIALMQDEFSKLARRYEHALRFAADQHTWESDVQEVIERALGDIDARRRANWDALSSDSYHLDAVYIDEDGSRLTGFVDRKYGLNTVWLNGERTEIDARNDSNLILTVKDDTQ